MYRFVFLILFFFTVANTFAQNTLSQGRWTSIEAKGKCSARHEASFVAHKGKFYLLGGRGGTTGGCI